MSTLTRQEYRHFSRKMLVPSNSIDEKNDSSLSDEAKTKKNSRTYKKRILKRSLKPDDSVDIQ